MIIQTTKNFDRQYVKLSLQVQNRFKQRLELFTINPFEVSLRNHALKGKYVGYRSIDITGDVRALYVVRDNTVMIFATIGTHAQLY